MCYRQLKTAVFISAPKPLSSSYLVHSLCSPFVFSSGASTSVLVLANALGLAFHANLHGQNSTLILNSWLIL